MKVEDVSEKNIENVFMICSGNRSFAPMEGPIQEKARELKRRWLLDMLERHGPCAKIAYLDGKPVAQVLFYPEETIPFIRDPRKDVLHLQCAYNSFPEAQRKGVGGALMKNLVGECFSGLKCMRGRACSFAVTKPFLHEGDLPLDEFYSKYGFKHGDQEMYLEINGEYMPSAANEYRPLPEDRDRTIILFNPACEWGYFAAVKIKELIQEMDPDHRLETFNIWERPEGYMKRSIQRVTSARVIVRTHLVNSSFWADQTGFRREVEETLGN